MTELRVGTGLPGPGRAKGSMNKLQRAAKEAIEMAADEIGGVDRLVAWIREDKQNERIFWGTVYPKLLPLTSQLTATLTVNWPLNKPALPDA